MKSKKTNLKKARTFVDVECRTAIDRADALVEQQKLRVSPVYHGMLNELLEKYANRLILWTDKFFRTHTDCVAVFGCDAMCPARNEDDQCDEQYNIWLEYGEIQSILYEIMNTGITDTSADQTTASNRTVSIPEATNTAKE